MMNCSGELEFDFFVGQFISQTLLTSRRSLMNIVLKSCREVNPTKQTSIMKEPRQFAARGGIFCLHAKIRVFGVTGDGDRECSATPRWRVVLLWMWDRERAEVL
jgi:hypothetical protein